MALVKPFIIQVAGYQNSGKTAAISRMIKEWSHRGKKVVTIKHHGHGGKPEVADEKDSSRHILSGAAASLVEGEGRLVIHAEKNTWSLSDKIKLMKEFYPDIIVIEGHKQAEFPKVVMIKDQKDLKLLSSLVNIIAIVYWDEDVLMGSGLAAKYPRFSIQDGILEKQLIDLLQEVHKNDTKR
ncbi:molybdopterin-guanine dinucleotide biosynthesis protein B [Neobacillus terrae]|uniref:molybdopterin-guanine dinucleotide biosynthesis protein B n=1 Tax=Neobacillus terrae TaxID=3034837 RepID=UPI00140AF444|nr:molybdopterin-guanine dinucleotide biosynthesis protein B [Neobacillus terrae]NHM33666.1 molybdopterin-guanine dinucleotide biosynthesis protein B [Neobacillus terrae]